jgi:hypothetical protein
MYREQLALEQDAATIDAVLNKDLQDNLY